MLDLDHYLLVAIILRLEIEFHNANDISLPYGKYQVGHQTSCLKYDTEVFQHLSNRSSRYVDLHYAMVECKASLVSIDPLLMMMGKL